MSPEAQNARLMPHILTSSLMNEIIVGLQESGIIPKNVVMEN